MTGPMPEVGVKFRADGLEGVRRGVKLVRDEAEPTARQWGTASRQIAGGLEQVARTGKVTGESLKSIISNGAEMAFMFGAGGPIVAALGILSVAIYEGITGRMKEARAEARAFQQEIAGVRRSGSLTGAGDLAQRLYSGDQYAVQNEGEDDRAYRARQLGVLGLRGEIARLTGIQNTGATQRDRITAYNEIQKLNPILKQYEERAAAAARAVNELAAAEGRRLATGARLQAEAFYADNRTPGVYVGSPVPGVASMLRTSGYGAAMNSLPTGKLRGIGKDRPADNPATVAMVEGMKAVGELAGQGFVDTLASTIEAGFTRIFSKGANIGGVFAAIADTALSGLGSIAVQIGRAALTQFAFIDKIAKAIASLNPAIGIAAAIGLIAFGSSLKGIGGRISANARGGGGGGYGAYSSSSGYGAAIIDRGIIDPTRGPTARSGNNYSFTIIGANDPKVQREIMELIGNAERRGVT